MGYLLRLAVHARRLVRQPIDELSRWQRMLRFSIELCRQGALQLQKDRATDMAAALTYRTIFSLVPIVVLSMLVFRMFVGLDDARRWLQDSTYNFLGWSSIKFEAPPPTASPSPEVRYAVPRRTADVGTDGKPARVGSEGFEVAPDFGRDPQAGFGPEAAAQATEAAQQSPGASSSDSPSEATSTVQPAGGGTTARGPPTEAVEVAIEDDALAASAGADLPELVRDAAADAPPQRSETWRGAHDVFPSDMSAGGPAAQAAAETLDQGWQASVDQKLDELVGNAWQVHLGQIGVAGGILFIWAALALMITIEDSFNTILNCPSGRSWFQRLTTYWAFITLGPGLLFISLWAAESVVQWSGEHHVLGGYTDLLMTVLPRLASLAASWLLLFVLYMWVPNASVQVKPALIGSFVAAVLWEGAKWGFRLYVTRLLPYSALYGSLGLIPLFLFWLYLTWLIILFGLEITAMLQAMHGWRLKELETRYKDRVIGDPQWMIPLMAALAQAFARGRTMTIDDLARRLHLPLSAVAGMTERLRRAGLLHRVNARGRGGSTDALTLARPPDRISVAGLLEVGRLVTFNQSRSPLPGPGWAFLERLVKAQKRAADGATLAELLATTDRPEEGPEAGAEQRGKRATAGSTPESDPLANAPSARSPKDRVADEASREPETPGADAHDVEPPVDDATEIPPGGRRPEFDDESFEPPTAPREVAHKSRR